MVIVGVVLVSLPTDTLPVTPVVKKVLVLFVALVAETAPQVPLMVPKPPSVKLPTEILVFVTLAVADPVGAIDKLPEVRVPLAVVAMVFAPLPLNIKLL